MRQWYLRVRLYCRVTIFLKCIYCTSSGTPLLAGEKWCECGHGCSIHLFQHRAELFYSFCSKLQLPSCFLCFFLTESAQVFSPCQVFPQTFCSPLAYRSTLVLSLTLTAALFPWSLCGYVDFGHQGEFQGEFCLALCSGLPCGGGIFDNRGCKEPLSV